MTSRLEDELRATLAGRSTGLPTSPDPYRTLRREIRSARRRTMATVTAAAMTVAALAVGATAYGPFDRSAALQTEPDRRTDDYRTPRPRMGEMNPEARRVLEAWKPAGDLASDAPAVAAAQAAAASVFGGAIPAEVRILYIARTGTDRTVLAVAPIQQNQVARALFVTRRGQLLNVQESSGGALGPNAGLVFMGWGQGKKPPNMQLLYVPAPGATAAKLSRTVEWHEDGRMTRGWADLVIGAQGAALVELPETDAARVRIWSGTRLVYDDSPNGARSGGRAAPGRDQLAERLVRDFGQSADWDSVDRVIDVVERNSGGAGEKSGIDDFRNLDARILWAGKAAIGRDATLIEFRSFRGSTVQCLGDKAAGGSGWASCRLVPASEAGTPFFVGYETPFDGTDGDCFIEVFVSGMGTIRVTTAGGKEVGTGVVGPDGRGHVRVPGCRPPAGGLRVEATTDAGTRLIHGDLDPGTDGLDVPRAATQSWP